MAASPRLAYALCLLLAASAVLGPAAVGGQSPLVDDASACGIAADRSGDRTASLTTPEPSSDGGASVARGDVAGMFLSTGNESVANGTIAARNGSYRVDLRLRDVDGDGAVAFRLNTYVAGAGEGSTGFEAVGPDEATVLNRTSAAETPLPVGTYDVRFPNAGTIGSDRIAVRNASIGEPTVYRAPPSTFDEHQTASEFRRAIDGGQYQPVDENVTRRDAVLYRIPVEGIFGRLRVAGGSSPEERFATIGRTDRRDDAWFQVAEYCRGYPDVSASVDNGAFNVVPDSSGGVLYVGLKPMRLVSGDGREMGNRRLTVDLALDHAPSEAVELEHALDRADFELRTGWREDVVVPPAEDVRIPLDTTLPRDTSIVVQLRSNESVSTRTLSATVRGNGTAFVEPDFSDVDSPERFDVSVVKPETDNVGSRGLLVREPTATETPTSSPTPTPTATADPEPTTTESPTATEPSRDGSPTETTSVEGPGFGVIGALGAWVFAVVVLRRRR